MEDALDVVAIMDLSTMSLLHHHLLEEVLKKKKFLSLKYSH